MRKPRLAIRWQWTMLVGCAVLLTLLVQFWILQDLEKRAWLQSHVAQDKLVVHDLAEELQLPMYEHSPEVDALVNDFLANAPDALGVYLHYADDEDRAFGSIDIQRSGMHERLHRTIRDWQGEDDQDREWHVRRVDYDGRYVGQVVVQFSSHGWQALSRAIYTRILLSTLVVLLLAGILVYWIARRMSKPLEVLSDGTRRLIGGDYGVRLALNRNDEISDAFAQFNALAAELEHKAKMRRSFGRYLNPELVSDVFEAGDANRANYRKEVTVLFADMVGFTRFAETASTEEVVEVLNDHFDAFHRIVTHYGGHVDKYIGDAVMAVFNHPHDDAEHPYHATMAGMAMTMACTRMQSRDRNGEPIVFRVGLNQGQVIVGNIGAAERLQYTVIGDAVNVASRMAGLVDDGQVMVSHSFFARMERSNLQFNSIGKRQIKGVRQQIQCGAVLPGDEATRQELEAVVSMVLDADRSSSQA